MIPLTRLPAPAILRDHAAQWTEKYLERRAETPRARPHAGQYGHEKIRDALAAMSHHKCFYCEGRPPRLTVDHHVEVEEAPEHAFEWENLYLACDDCQNKLENRVLPVADCVDPCSTFEPDEHFTFDDDVIRSRSPKGDATIRKYRLNSDRYNGRRAQALNNFARTLHAIRERQIAEQRAHLSPEEVEVLRRFAAPDWPYSLMFRIYLRRSHLDSPPGP